MRCAAPLCECLTTNMSACIADRFATVSNKVSPLLWEDVPTLRLMTSAERRFAAISKVVRVRVDASKKRLKTAFPRNKAPFLFHARPRTRKKARYRECEG